MDANLKSIKADLSRRTRSGINYWLAELVIWAGFAVIGFFPDSGPDKPLWYVLAAVAVWPLALAIGVILRTNVFGRGNALSLLYVLICAIPVFFAPVLMSAYGSNAQALPWYLGIVTGIQSLLFAWLFESSAYLFCSLGTLEASILIAWLASAFAYTAAPLIIVVVILVSTYYISRSSATKQLLSAN